MIGDQMIMKPYFYLENGQNTAVYLSTAIEIIIKTEQVKKMAQKQIKMLNYVVLYVEIHPYTRVAAIWINVYHSEKD